MLGLLEVPKPEILAGRGGFWLGAGDRSVHVGVDEGIDRAKTKAHVAYEVLDLAEMRRKLAAAGSEVTEGIPIPGHDRLELRDPFGNRLELIQPHALVLPPAARVEVAQTITTERLELRQPTSATLERDTALLHSAIMESLPELQRWMKWVSPTPPPEKTRENLRRAIEGWRMRRELRLLLFLKGTDALIGSSGMHNMEWDIPRFEIGYWVHTAFAGNGYMTEAISAIRDLASKQLGARRLEIRTSGGNQRSQRVAKRCGFALEAVLKSDERMLDGALGDTHVYVRMGE